MTYDFGQQWIIVRRDDGAWEHRVSIKTDPHSFTCTENLEENEIFKWLSACLSANKNNWKFCSQLALHLACYLSPYPPPPPPTMFVSVRTFNEWKYVACEQALHFVPLAIHGELASRLENTIQWNPVNTTTVWAIKSWSKNEMVALTGFSAEQ